MIIDDPKPEVSVEPTPEEPAPLDEPTEPVDPALPDEEDGIEDPSEVPD